MRSSREEGGGELGKKLQSLKFTITIYYSYIIIKSIELPLLLLRLLFTIIIIISTNGRKYKLRNGT